jgi:hypothetical protein
VVNPAAAAGRLPIGQWQSRLEELRELPPAESLAAAEELLGELEKGLDSL